jgi:3-hydroxyacyl-[acyl-carrier protein] dehydratase/trans-2-decenoyl-[acyl-carrier protein] isomerase
MITYENFIERKSFNFQELLALSHGNLISNPPFELPQLPAPPFLMFDRITEIVRNPRGGRIVAEQDIKLDAWFFQCHFRGDPVQPGCLGVDAVWQLTGFWGCLMGAPGCGRALGAKEISFNGQVRPHNKIVKYDLFNLKYIKTSNQALMIGDANVYVDDKLIYEIKGQKVGAFTGIKYKSYPWEGSNGEEK